MCLMCEGWTADEMHADTHDRIRRYGFAMFGVRDGDGGPTWLYSIGLADHDHPELVIANVELDSAHAVLTDLAARVLDGDRLDEARRVAYLDVVGEATLRDVHPAHLAGELIAAWHGYYAWRDAPAPPPPRVLQVVAPDEAFCRCHAGTQPRLDLAHVTFRPAASNRRERRAATRRRRGRAR